MHDDNYISQIKRIHCDLGIDQSYLHDHVDWILPVADKSSLVDGGLDTFGRHFYLIEEANAAWENMQKYALKDSVILEVVSAFRDLEYQANLIKRKLSNGYKINEIIKLNAPPGFSEHHTGRALDLTTPEENEFLTESFEDTKAFKWLSQYAKKYNFVLSYPRNNNYGYIYEPWHWCFNF
ncbi:D-alanyl-D-alanine carboxypeptidase family protein [Thiotrichales bacterium 19S11-10]|nr:D-alanyl-D-alanine carboxypeptidase family protein [Thiotrichales bacterium 19S11-10]MCF6808149.1 D-alanyl-D-alanine carboxypeptidase family protein [Thiotrichales bacterium 19S9-11]MCF6812165.1 D-alanyl-D-alanine carboxypeptidase family protein [Thiotrichales bacterium 19S9-12]